MQILSCALVLRFNLEAQLVTFLSISCDFSLFLFMIVLSLYLAFDLNIFYLLVLFESTGDFLHMQLIISLTASQNKHHTHHKHTLDKFKTLEYPKKELTMIALG